MHSEILKNRVEAGLLLSEKLNKYQKSNTVVLAIPRGGLPIGYEIAKKLHLPLDIILSKKISHPYNREFAIGAVSLDSIILDEHPDISKQYIDNEIIRLRTLLKEKSKLYKGDLETIDIEGKNVIIVDDGIATGNTILASISMIRKKNPAKIIVAVPVLPFDSLKTFEKQTDEFIYLMVSKNFGSVGRFYEDFPQVEDHEAIQILHDLNTNQ
jgi:putative phosphoribosyl transferase